MKLDVRTQAKVVKGIKRGDRTPWLMRILGLDQKSIDSIRKQMEEAGERKVKETRTKVLAKRKAKGQQGRLF